MKKTLLMALAFFCALTTYGQITFEHTYAGNAQVILFSANGEKIMLSDTTSIYLYNMDHTLWKTITPTHYTGYKVSQVSSVSDHLFNSDDLVELIVGYSGSGSMHPYYKSDIINESASVLFSLDSTYTGYPHYDEASSSYKLFTLNYLVPGYATKVYAVPGTMPCGQCSGLGVDRTSGQKETITISDPMPNPSTGVAKIIYTLPYGTTYAAITFYNSVGQVVKELPVVPQSGNVDINNSMLRAGTYLYNLKANNITSDTKTMIIK